MCYLKKCFKSFYFFVIWKTEIFSQRKVKRISSLPINSTMKEVLQEMNYFKKYDNKL